MARGCFRFEDFTLDPHDRRLSRRGAPVALNARYLDALLLLVRHPGELVSKDRFMAEVWRGAAVTDEALTQCVRTLRRRLGDEAGRPRFIETVPKHGYRFVAPVQWLEDARSGPAEPSSPGRWREVLRLGLAGLAGAGAAGLVAGLAYGLAATANGAPGAASAVLVLICLTLVVAAAGGGGVAFGLAVAGFGRSVPGPRLVLGGAAGGLLVGAIVKLIGLDAFQLLFGAGPERMTGAWEGALLGAAIGLGAWISRDDAEDLSRPLMAAGAVGAAAGLIIPLLGGRLLGGSLDLLAQQFPDSRLSLDAVGRLVGEAGFGPRAQALTGALEGLLFAVGLLWAMALTRRRLTHSDRPTSASA